MKKRWLASLCLVIVLIGIPWAAGQAGSSTPQTPSIPPRPIHPSRPAETLAAPASPLDLPPLTAVLLVGPIDGDEGPWTTQEKANMDLAAAELEANGVTVYKFYTPNNDWEQIKAAANGAHFLFYRGHGVYWSPMPSPTVGGFALKDHFVSSDDIRNDLNLAPNAIVMLYGCFTAGSSSIDQGSISSGEAQRRVAQYSDPFFDIGAAGYYADWFGNAFQLFVRYLFQGMTLGQAYESFYDFDSATVERYTHPDHPSLAMWLDKDYWSDVWQYNNAFVGQPDQALIDLFQVTRMEVTPGSINLLAEADFPPRVATLQVDSTTSTLFNWTASVVSPVSWLEVNPPGGSSGGTITVTSTPTGLPPGTYQTGIRIVADDPTVENGDQTIPVTLHIVDQVFVSYLPLVVASAME